jgi:hypothetical protein
MIELTVTPVLEGIGDDKIRVNSSSLDHPLTILADQDIEIVGIEKKVMERRTMRLAYWLNHDLSGLTEAGYGPAKGRRNARPLL